MIGGHGEDVAVFGEVEKNGNLFFERPWQTATVLCLEIHQFLTIVKDLVLLD